MAADTYKSWDDILKESEFLITEEPTFLEEAEENIEELAYGFEKSRWLAGNAARYVMAGGDEDVLKKQEAERLAEIEGRYDLSEERKQSGFALTGEIGGTLLDPSAIALGYADFRSYKNNSATGKERISRHLTNMMGGTIAVITAVLVVNPPFEPEWVWWVLPTVLITPVIFWWNFKILK